MTSIIPYSETAHLDEFENQSIYILREAYRKFEKMAMLWSIGRDSTILLWLARKAFAGHCPIPLAHIDTTPKIDSSSWTATTYRRRNHPAAGDVG